MDHTIKPACRNPAVSACDVADRRFKRNVDALHRQGPRVIAELLRYLGATSFCMTAIEQATARFAALDSELLRAVGADRFPPGPDLRPVGGRHAPR